MLLAREQKTKDPGTDRIEKDFKPAHYLPRMPLTLPQQRLLIWAALSLALLGVLWLLGPVLTPFVIASILAYTLAPVVARMEKRLPKAFPRVVLVLVAELGLLLAILGLFVLLVPVLVKQLPLLRDQIPALLDHVKALAQTLGARLGLSMELDLASVKAFLMEHLATLAQDGMVKLLASVKLGGSLALALLGNAVLIPVVLFYLLYDWSRLVRLARDFIPPRFRASSDGFFKEADAVLGQYLRGQLLVMLALALYYSLGLRLFGLDLAWPIGIFTGLAVAVPYLGFGVGLILATLAGLLEFASPVDVIPMIAVVYGGGQLIESFFLTPRLVGERVGLHPLAVIFALLAFGQLLGFVGVLMALPISAVLLVALRRLRKAYLTSSLYQERA